ncbi:VOC family protein [uncultured Zhongshania sp.]|uniref:VOC family protein n=1 Tax=uncultured Zhongshania sp. TaxID=1642288 RepID=UPI0025F280DC|nr:VOC family protein [uncultured Zhongshania sp.]
MKINPYLNFAGNCRQAFEFYAACLGLEPVIMAVAETPAAEHFPADSLHHVMHAQIDNGNGLTLMGCDAPAEMYERPAGTSVAIQADTIAEAERVFAALSEGGSITMPIAETFWSQRFGAFVDQFGISWMVNGPAPIGAESDCA